MIQNEKKWNSKTSMSYSRRSFISTAGLATAVFSIIPNHVLAGRGKMQPSDMVNVAAIGIGAQGFNDIQQIATPDVPVTARTTSSTGQPVSPEQIAAQQKRMQGIMGGQNLMGGQVLSQQTSQPEVVKIANIYALCDVDTGFSGRVMAGYPKAKKYTDWREMLEKEPSIDAALIATPDHNHATIAAHFIRGKKHVYVEKPMCKTIAEVRTLTRLAQEYDIISQMGNQGHAREGTPRAIEYIQSGVIGHIREVECNSFVPTWPQGNLTRPAGVKVPDTLNYDVWLGPAPVKPYHPDCLHFNWRGLWDYGTGAIGDIGAHVLDSVVLALNLGMPTRIQASSTAFSGDYMPAGEIIKFDFPERFTPGIGYMPPVSVVWSDGGLKPFRPDEFENGTALKAILYKGDKGMIMMGTPSQGGLPELVNADPDFKGPDPWIPRTANNYADWIMAIRNGTKSNNDFSISSKLTEIMLLANIAIKFQNNNAVLEYDAENMRFTNMPEANSLLQYEYRAGWTL